MPSTVVELVCSPRVPFLVKHKMCHKKCFRQIQEPKKITARVFGGLDGSHDENMNNVYVTNAV